MISTFSRAQRATLQLFVSWLLSIIPIHAFGQDNFCDYKFHTRREYEGIVNQLKQPGQKNTIHEMYYFKNNGDETSELYCFIINSVVFGEESFAGFKKEDVQSILRYFHSNDVQYRKGRLFPIKEAYYFDSSDNGEYRVGSEPFKIHHGTDTYKFYPSSNAEVYSGKNVIEKIGFFSSYRASGYNIEGKEYLSLWGKEKPSMEITQEFRTDKVYINEKVTDFNLFFPKVNYDKFTAFKPWQYIYTPYGSIISYKIEYLGKPVIVYDRPLYVVSGNLAYAHHGGYEEWATYYNQGYISKIDSKAGKTKKTIALDKIAEPTISAAGKHLVIYNKSYYDEERCISQDGSPIYLTDWDLNTEMEIQPEDGDVYLDIQETPDYWVLCGTTKEHGYKGQNNPLLVIIDKNTHKTIKRVISDPLKAWDGHEYGWYYRAVGVINDNTLVAFGKFWDDKKTQAFNLFELSTLLPEELQSSSIKPYGYILSNDESLRQFGLDKYTLPNNDFLGLCHVKPRSAITPPLYRSIKATRKMLEQGVVLAAKEDEGWGLLGLDGKEITPFEYYLDPGNQDIVGDVLFLRNNVASVGGIDKHGRLVIPFEYHEIVPIKSTVNGESAAYVRCIDNRKGVVSFSGRTIVPLGDYSFIEHLDDDFFIVGNGSQRGIYSDSRSACTIEPQYDELIPAKKVSGEQYYIVRAKEEYGLFSINGEKHINTEYDKIWAIDEYSFVDSKNFLKTGCHYIVEKQGKYGVYSLPKKELVFEPLFDEINTHKAMPEPLLILKNNGKAGLFTFDGETVIAPEYTDLYSVNRDFLVAQKKSQYGVINNKGETVLPFKKYGIKKDDKYLIVVYNGDSIETILGAKDKNKNALLKNLDLSRCVLNTKYSVPENKMIQIVSYLSND